MEFTRTIDMVLAEQERRKNAQRYFNDVGLWAQDILGVRLWDKQTEIGNLLLTHKSVAVKAAHGVGKSFFAAALICWWIDTRYPRVFVASTAPSQAQIGAIVWRLVRKFKKQISDRYKAGIIDHELPGYITADNQWKEDGGNILGFGRKPPDNKEDDSFQGIHDGYVLAIGDEAVGLTPEMIDALGNITSNEDSRRLIICNPTNPASYVGKLFREQTENWSFQTISAFDSPNFTEERHLMSAEALSELVGPSYVEDKKLEYGEDSPRYKSRVLGEFAYDLGDTLIKPEDLAIAADTNIKLGGNEPVILGIDIARFGKDASVIYSNIGGKLRFVDDKPDQARVTETAAWIHRTAIDLNATEVRIDSLGIGGGVIDALVDYHDAPSKYTLLEMNANGVTPDRKQWHNARAYWWDEFRRNLRDGKIDMDPTEKNYERVNDELMSVEYTYAKTGGLLVEAKEDMRKRGIKSPDFADAAIYASADMNAIVNATAQPGDKVRTDAADIIGDVPYFYDLMRTF